MAGLEFTEASLARKTCESYEIVKANGGSKSADILNVKVRIGIWKKRIPYQYKSLQLEISSVQGR